MGRRDKTVSLVLPVPDVDHLIEAELRAQPFADKIAWDIVPRRRGKLHATLCGAPVVLDEAARQALAGIGPIGVELRGLFSGTVNHGRLYLRVYPEKRDGENPLAHVQRLLGRRETGLYLVGLHNLVDDLDAREAAALAASDRTLVGAADPALAGRCPVAARSLGRPRAHGCHAGQDSAFRSVRRAGFSTALSSMRHGRRGQGSALRAGLGAPHDFLRIVVR